MISVLALLSIYQSVSGHESGPTKASLEDQQNSIWNDIDALDYAQSVPDMLQNIRLENGIKQDLGNHLTMPNLKLEREDSSRNDVETSVGTHAVESVVKLQQVDKPQQKAAEQVEKPQQKAAESPSDAQQTGNCLTQRIDFKDLSRFFNLQNAPFPIKDLSSQLDVSRYDMTVDYGNLTRLASGNVGLTIVPKAAGGDPQGTRISSTRFLKYGKVTASFKAVPIKGVVTTFITAGPNPSPSDPDVAKVPKDKISTHTGDEIDFEILGKDANQGTNNVWWRGLLEYSKHDSSFAIPKGIASTNKYSIEWKRDTITFSLNDKVLRTYSKNGPEADSELLPGVRFFPDRPQKVQMALWSEATNTWAGGAAQLKQGGEVAEIEYIDIICYDDSEKPVAKYPTNAPDRFATVPNQPLVLVNGAFPSSAGPQSKGAKKESPPKPEGYNGALTDNGSVPDSGSNDGSGQSGQSSAGNSNGGNSNTNTSTFGDKKPSGEVDLAHLNGLVLLALLFSYLL